MWMIKQQRICWGTAGSRGTHASRQLLYCMHSCLDNKQDFPPPPTGIYHNARRACTIEIWDVVYVTQHKQIPFERTSCEATCYASKLQFPYSCFVGCSEEKCNANRRFVTYRIFLQYKTFLRSTPYCMS